MECERLERLVFTPYWKVKDFNSLTRQREKVFNQGRGKSEDQPITPHWNPKDYQFLSHKRDGERLRRLINGPREIHTGPSPRTDPFGHDRSYPITGCIFITMEGYLGRSPHQFPKRAPLDVFVLRGCRMPLVLQRIESHYRLCGEVFVDGIMFGEAMEAAKGRESKRKQFRSRSIMESFGHEENNERRSSRHRDDSDCPKSLYREFEIR